MIALVFLATVINYLDRQTLSVVAPILRDEFRMSNETYGRVLAAFLLAYTVMNGVSGPLIDRLGTRVGYALVMAWWSAAGMLHALARGALSLGFFRFLLGMGEAGNWPAGVKVVAEWFPPKERARGFDLAAIGKYAWIPFLAADIGNLAGGWLSGELIRRGVSLNVARKSAVTFFDVLMTSAIPAVLAADASGSIACVAVASFGYTGALANMLAFPADGYPK